MDLYAGFMKGEKLFEDLQLFWAFLKSQAAKISLSSSACILPLRVLGQVTLPSEMQL